MPACCSAIAAQFEQQMEYCFGEVR